MLFVWTTTWLLDVETAVTDGLAGSEFGVGSKVKMPLSSSSDEFKLRPTTVAPFGDWTDRLVSLRGSDPFVLILYFLNCGIINNLNFF